MGCESTGMIVVVKFVSGKLDLTQNLADILFIANHKLGNGRKRKGG